ncbi:hypothetical protein SNEBB_004994 [Seison nebaliae]|nr:hypothetical protein SNEBB_004994 [Seison nebaliae]
MNEKKNDFIMFPTTNNEKNNSDNKKQQERKNEKVIFTNDLAKILRSKFRDIKEIEILTDYLCEIDPFTSINRDLVLELSNYIKLVELDVHEILYRKGDVALEWFILIEGVVTVDEKKRNIHPVGIIGKTTHDSILRNETIRSLDNSTKLLSIDYPETIAPKFRKKISHNNYLTSPDLLREIENNTDIKQQVCCHQQQNHHRNDRVRERKISNEFYSLKREIPIQYSVNLSSSSSSPPPPPPPPSSNEIITSSSTATTVPYENYLTSKNHPTQIIQSTNNVLKDLMSEEKEKKKKKRTFHSNSAFEVPIRLAEMNENLKRPKGYKLKKEKKKLNDDVSSNTRNENERNNQIDESIYRISKNFPDLPINLIDALSKGPMEKTDLEKATILSFIEQFSVFKLFHDNTLTSLCSHMQCVHIDGREVFIKEEEHDSWCMLISGECEWLITPEQSHQPHFYPYTSGKKKYDNIYPNGIDELNMEETLVGYRLNVGATFGIVYPTYLKQQQMGMLRTMSEHTFFIVIQQRNYVDILQRSYIDRIPIYSPITQELLIILQLSENQPHERNQLTLKKNNNSELHSPKIISNSNNHLSILSLKDGEDEMETNKLNKEHSNQIDDSNEIQKKEKNDIIGDEKEEDEIFHSSDNFTIRSLFISDRHIFSHAQDKYFHLKYANEKCLLAILVRIAAALKLMENDEEMNEKLRREMTYTHNLFILPSSFISTFFLTYRMFIKNSLTTIAPPFLRWFHLDLYKNAVADLVLEWIKNVYVDFEKNISNIREFLTNMETNLKRCSMTATLDVIYYTSSLVSTNRFIHINKSTLTSSSSNSSSKRLPFELSPGFMVGKNDESFKYQNERFIDDEKSVNDDSRRNSLHSYNPIDHIPIDNGVFISSVNSSITNLIFIGDQLLEINGTSLERLPLYSLGNVRRYLEQENELKLTVKSNPYSFYTIKNSNVFDKEKQRLQLYNHPNKDIKPSLTITTTGAQQLGNNQIKLNELSKRNRLQLSTMRKCFIRIFSRTQSESATSIMAGISSKNTSGKLMVRGGNYSENDDKKLLYPTKSISSTSASGKQLKKSKKKYRQSSDSANDDFDESLSIEEKHLIELYDKKCEIANRMNEQLSIDDRLYREDQMYIVNDDDVVSCQTSGIVDSDEQDLVQNSKSSKSSSINLPKNSNTTPTTTVPRKKEGNYQRKKSSTSSLQPLTDESSKLSINGKFSPLKVQTSPITSSCSPSIASSSISFSHKPNVNSTVSLSKIRPEECISPLKKQFDVGMNRLLYNTKCARRAFSPLSHHCQSSIPLDSNFLTQQQYQIIAGRRVKKNTLVSPSPSSSSCLPNGENSKKTFNQKISLHANRIDEMASIQCHVIKIFKEDNSFNYLTIYETDSVEDIIKSFLHQYNSTSNTPHQQQQHQTSHYSLYTFLLLEHKSFVRKCLGRNDRNIAARLDYNGRLYLLPTCQTNIETNMESMRMNLNEEISLLELDELEVAAQLSLRDLYSFRCIHPVEYVYRLKASKKNPNAFNESKRLYPNILKFEEITEQETFWVVTELTAEENCIKRMKLLKKFITIADYCLQLKNFNAFFSIMGGLDHSAVSRLKLTWEKLPDKFHKKFRSLQSIFDPSENMRKYRDRLCEARCCPPVIPLFPICMKDLTFIQECVDGHYEDDKSMVNFQKMQQLSKGIQANTDLSFVGLTTAISKLYNSIVPFYQIFLLFNIDVNSLPSNHIPSFSSTTSNSNNPLSNTNTIGSTLRERLSSAKWLKDYKNQKMSDELAKHFFDETIRVKKVKAYFNRLEVKPDENCLRSRSYRLELPADKLLLALNYFCLTLRQYYMTVKTFLHYEHDTWMCNMEYYSPSGVWKIDESLYNRYRQKLFKIILRDYIPDDFQCSYLFKDTIFLDLLIEKFSIDTLFPFGVMFFVIGQCRSLLEFRARITKNAQAKTTDLVYPMIVPLNGFPKSAPATPKMLTVPMARYEKPNYMALNRNIDVLINDRSKKYPKNWIGRILLPSNERYMKSLIRCYQYEYDQVNKCEDLPSNGFGKSYEKILEEIQDICDMKSLGKELSCQLSTKDVIIDESYGFSLRYASLARSNLKFSLDEQRQLQSLCPIFFSSFLFHQLMNRSPKEIMVKVRGELVILQQLIQEIDTESSLSPRSLEMMNRNKLLDYRLSSSTSLFQEKTVPFIACRVILNGEITTKYSFISSTPYGIVQDYLSQMVNGNNNRNEGNTFSFYNEENRKEQRNDSVELTVSSIDKTHQRNNNSFDSEMSLFEGYGTIVDDKPEHKKSSKFDIFKSSRYHKKKLTNRKHQEVKKRKNEKFSKNSSNLDLHVSPTQSTSQEVYERYFPDLEKFQPPTTSNLQEKMLKHLLSEQHRTSLYGCQRNGKNVSTSPTTIGRINKMKRLKNNHRRISLLYEHLIYEKSNKIDYRKKLSSQHKRIGELVNEYDEEMMRFSNKLGRFFTTSNRFLNTYNLNYPLSTSTEHQLHPQLYCRSYRDKFDGESEASYQQKLADSNIVIQSAPILTILEVSLLLTEKKFLINSTRQLTSEKMFSQTSSTTSSPPLSPTGFVDQRSIGNLLSFSTPNLSTLFFNLNDQLNSCYWCLNVDEESFNQYKYQYLTIKELKLNEEETVIPIATPSKTDRVRSDRHLHTLQLDTSSSTSPNSAILSKAKFFQDAFTFPKLPKNKIIRSPIIPNRRELPPTLAPSYSVEPRPSSRRSRPHKKVNNEKKKSSFSEQFSELRRMVFRDKYHVNGFDTFAQFKNEYFDDRPVTDLVYKQKKDP